jgi:DNA repair protein RecO (recombination protein O)
MVPRSYKTEAVILKRSNLGEADKLITVLTPKMGKLRCVAKGVRRLHSRKAPSLELFSRVNLFLARGKTLDLVTEANLVSSFPRLKGDLERVRYAYQFVEVISAVTRENQDTEALYALLVKALEWLDRTNQASQEGLRRFQLRLLEDSGFGLPPTQDVESLTAYIESIIDRRLVTGKHLKVT